MADFNGDGSPDLAVADGTSNDVSILLGNGDGTFQLPQFVNVGTNPQSLAVGDFNGDGILDLAVADNGDDFGHGQGVSVLLGNGDGSFQAPLTLAVGNGPSSVVVGDFNGDGTRTWPSAWLVSFRTEVW